MQKSPPPSHSSGFTLVELLVVVAIIAILAALAFSGVSAMKITASKTVSVANLKNFSTAMYASAADNNGNLPGANDGTSGTLHGISPIAKASAANSLQVQLMTYLQKDRPSGNSWGTYFMKSLSYPLWQSYNKGTNDNQIPAYIACQNYPMPDDSTFSPFGGSSASQLPLNLASLQACLERFTNSKPYAMIEADQKLYNSVKWLDPSWKKNLSTNALHGKVRNVLYFDGSVQAVSVNQVPYPW